MYSHEGEPRGYNIPQDFTPQGSSQIIITTEFKFVKQGTSEFKIIEFFRVQCSGKITINYSTIHDVSMKPV
ncbi:hypothetical protein C2845_PM03G30530 [Panicum miliaceum]|uniref:Uncharacterized protein n=1 Tax=Panicum miliaceum TaxID=4540 RepID=A0A3L6TDF3_PANMI|nr:hypothetical protein C2845_PM03G30530 [Panicum miliaceum]